MILIGLTGGLASGKSTVASLFQKCGAIIIDADQLARKVAQPKKAAWKDLVKIFGSCILNPDKSLDRQALAHIVFRNPKKLKILNKIIHPRVAREQTRLTKAIAKKKNKILIIYDAALLIEANAQKRMDYVIVVTANKHTQIIRVCRRDGLSKNEALRRINSQLTFQQKIKHADFLIDGTLPLPKLKKVVNHLYQSLTKQIPKNKLQGLNRRTTLK